MNNLRHRIRIITLAIICSLLAMILWTVKSAWFPDAITPENLSESVSAAPPDPWENPVASETAEEQKLPEAATEPSQDTPSPEPLFNTYGL